jgi:type II secretory pathway pseudopilin PulG
MDNQKSNRRQCESGITLLEVTLAVVIIAVFVSILIISRDDIISTAVNSNSLRIARMLASQKMEEILLAQVAEEEEEAVSGTFENHPGFTWDETTEDVSLITDEEREDGVQEIYVTRVTLNVSYENAGGEKVQYSLATIIPYKEGTGEGDGGS